MNAREFMDNKVFKIRLKKGDMVVVRSGKYKGKTGKINATYPWLNKVEVEGINIVKKHTKPSSKNPQGGILEITRPIDVSKVGIVVPGSEKSPRPSRIGYSFTKDGVKQRTYKATGKEIKS